MVDIRPTRVNIQQRVLEKIHDGCAQSAVDARRHVRCILLEGVISGLGPAQVARYNAFFRAERGLGSTERAMLRHREQGHRLLGASSRLGIRDVVVLLLSSQQSAMCRHVGPSQDLLG